MVVAAPSVLVPSVADPFVYASCLQITL